MKNYLKMRSKTAQETMNLHHAIVQNVIMQMTVYIHKWYA